MKDEKVKFARMSLADMTSPPDLTSEELRTKLKRAGFDVKEKYEVFKGVNNFSYLFTQGL